MKCDEVCFQFKTSFRFFADVANRIKVENSNGADFSESQRKCLDGCRQTIETRLARDQVSVRAFLFLKVLLIIFNLIDVANISCFHVISVSERRK